ncbi:AzlD domain-containing protein [Roseibium salinum]|nr:AzlD domain-containing protein [Roseibium salinum]
MTLVTYTLRAGGYWVMGRLPITPRVRRGLEALPGAIIVSTVLPIVFAGRTRRRALPHRCRRCPGAAEEGIHRGVLRRSRRRRAEGRGGLDSEFHQAVRGANEWLGCNKDPILSKCGAVSRRTGPLEHAAHASRRALRPSPA